MSAEELEQACRKCVRLVVTNTEKLAIVLDKMSLEYKIIDSETADVFGKPNLTKLTMALSEQGCELLSAKEQDESLESFYISLVGGGRK